MIDYRTLHEDNWLSTLLRYAKDPSGKDGAIPNLVDRTLAFAKGKPRRYNQDGVGGYEDYIINRNIAKTANKLTAVFPVIVSKAVDIETAVMISKAVERKAVTLLQMLFAANQISTAKHAAQYLSKFHHNLSSKLDISGMDVDDVLAYTELDDDQYKEVWNENANLAKQCKDIYDHVAKDIHYVLETKIINPPINDIHVLNEISVGGTRRYKSYTFGKEKTGMRDKLDKDGNTMTYEKDIKGKNGTILHHAGDTIRTPYTYNTSPRYDDNGRITNLKDAETKVEIKPEEINARPLKDLTDVLKNQILPGEVKKANEAQPTLMVINFQTESKLTGAVIQNSCVIGVKALLHYVDPEDIVNRVLLKQSDSRGLFNLIKATTGEIAFFKDFLFAVDRAKVDAVAKSGKGSSDKVWKLLELRAEHLNARKASRSGEADCSAIATLVISQEEVDHIKQFHRIDLNKAGTFKSILRGYNMMAGAIVDSVTEKVDFLWDDGQTMFESLSFMSLEREDSGTMYKKVINLATKGR